MIMGLFKRKKNHNEYCNDHICVCLCIVRESVYSYLRIYDHETMAMNEMEGNIYINQPHDNH